MSPNITILRFTPFFIRDILLPRPSNDEAPLNLSTNSRGDQEATENWQSSKVHKFVCDVDEKIKRSLSVQNVQKKRRRENGRRALKEARVIVFCVLNPLFKHDDNPKWIIFCPQWGLFISLLKYDNNPQMDHFVSSIRGLLVSLLTTIHKCFFSSSMRAPSLFVEKWQQSTGDVGDDEDGKKKMRTTFTGKQVSPFT